jgi:hypothetical protein
MTYVALILACTLSNSTESCRQVIAINITSYSRIECVVNAQSYVHSAIFNSGEYVKVICASTDKHSSGSLYVAPVQ